MKGALLLSVVSLCVMRPSISAELTRVIDPDWTRIEGDVTTDLSIQVCVEPPLREESPIKNALYASLRAAKVNFARLQFWYPYPRLSVAELEPPAEAKTHWDFSILDSIVSNFYQASEGRPIMVNFGTVPQWMYLTSGPVSYPRDPNEIDWDYLQGTEFRDPSLREVRDYYERVASWYVQGGFADELGRRHESGHRYKFDYWEVLNEVDFEHHLSPQLYTKLYDEIVEAVRKVSPDTKFSALALTDPSTLGSPPLPYSPPEYFEYFLDRHNHKVDVPLDMISYHFYAAPSIDEPLASQQFTFFQQADAFASTVRYIESIRKRLSPGTKTFINEIGATTAHPLSTRDSVPAEYWHLSGALFAHLYIELLKLGIDVVGAAELIDYPGQVAELSLSDWRTGRPNARFQIVNLLHRSVNLGDKLVLTDPHLLPGSSMLDATYSGQALLASDGTRKLLLINRRNRPLGIRVAGAKGARMEYVDTSTGSNAPHVAILKSESVTLGGYAVAVVTLPKLGLRKSRSASGARARYH